jgi:protein-S-isoprenylcysteine O-methyltransferase Ste14
MRLHGEIVNQGNFLFRYRSFLPLVLLPIAFWVVYAQVQSDAMVFSCDSMSSNDWLALIVCFFGLIIRIVTVGYTPANTSGRNTKAGQVADTVNQTGMYSTVRHPLYVGNYFMWLGIAVYTGHWWFVGAFTLVYWLYYERIMAAEESFMTDKFGSGYAEWADSVPTFIPAIGNWKTPALPFSVKKVLKSEKNGLLAIFLVLWILQIWANYLKTDQWSLCLQSLFFYGTLATGFSYLTLKVVKHQTNLLNEEGR